MGSLCNGVLCVPVTQGDVAAAALGLFTLSLK